MIKFKFTSQDAIAAFVSMVLVAPFVWMVSDRSIPYIVTNGSIEPSRAEPGSTVQVTWNIKILRSCHPNNNSTVVRTFIDRDGIRHVAEAAKSSFKSDQSDISKIQNHVVVPTVMPEGPARYWSRACYPCNPIQEIWPICINTPEIAFEVIKPPPTEKADRNK